jgi:hypothetical protein
MTLSAGRNRGARMLLDQFIDDTEGQADRQAALTATLSALPDTEVKDTLAMLHNEMAWMVLEGETWHAAAALKAWATWPSLPDRFLPGDLAEGHADVLSQADPRGGLLMDRLAAVLAAHGHVRRPKSPPPVESPAPRKPPAPAPIVKKPLRVLGSSSGPVEANVVYGGVALGKGDALRQRLRDGITGAQSLPLRANHREPHDWIAEAWTELSKLVDARRTLRRAMGDLLTDEDVRVRAGAIWFFTSVSKAPGIDALCKAFDSLQLYDGVPDPIGGRGDLRGELGRALAQRVSRTAPKALEILRREILRPGGARPVWAGMKRHDGRWVKEHAAEIVEASPDAAGLVAKL